MTVRLNVFFEAEMVGSVYDTQPLSFEYAGAWLASASAHQIANVELRPARSPCGACGPKSTTTSTSSSSGRCAGWATFSKILRGNGVD